MTRTAKDFRETSTWSPTCSVRALRARAELLATIRQFFAARGVLEVETPLLSRSVATEPGLQAFTCHYHSAAGRPGSLLYLQTSPEFAMKRLLAAGSGCIYQICKAFRDGERGRHHHPEFTLLEWYRLGFSLDELMDEVEALLGPILAGSPYSAPAERLAYRSLFQQQTGVDPIAAPVSALRQCARDIGLADAARWCGEDRALWLDFLFSTHIQPGLGRSGPCFVYDYPACLPSLARRHPTESELVERVELFLGGLELANGFRELTDPEEQAARFARDLAERQAQGLPSLPMAEELLSALAAGLPDCSGIALGLDRLLSLLLDADSLDDVLAFPVERC